MNDMRFKLVPVANDDSLPEKDEVILDIGELTKQARWVGNTGRVGNQSAEGIWNLLHGLMSVAEYVRARSDCS